MKSNSGNCPSCGAQDKSDNLFCEYCGTKLREPSFWDNKGKEETKEIKINNRFLVVFIGILIYFISAFVIKNNTISSSLITKDYVHSITQFFLSQFRFLGFTNFSTNSNFFSLIVYVYDSFPRKIIFLILFFIADVFILWGVSNGVPAKRQSILRAFWTSIFIAITTILFIGWLSLFNNGLIIGILLVIFVTPIVIKANHQTTYGGGMGILFAKIIITLMSLEFIFILSLY